MPFSTYKKETWLITGGILLVFVFMLYRYWHGEDSYIRLHDYGEVYLPLFRAMDLGDLFSLKPTFDPFLGGIKRNALGSEFNIGNLMHAVLPTFTAVILNELIIRLTAFLGLYLFLEESVRTKWPLLAFITALTFA